MRKAKRIFLLALMFSLAVLTACDHKCKSSLEWSFDGTNHWHKCIDCEETFDVTKHQLTWKVKTVATCKVALVEEGVCACGYTTIKTGSKKEHQLEDLAGHIPTCTETGLTEGKKCTVCHEIIVAQEEVAALGHEEEIIAAVSPTCTETGLTEGKECAVCHEIIVAQEEVAALGHEEEIIAAVSPTCTETGLTEGKECTVCHEITVEQKEVAALGHDITSSHYEEQDGILMLVEICSRCGILKTEVDKTKPLEVDNFNDLEWILSIGYDSLLTASIDFPHAIVISKDVKVTIPLGVEITLTKDNNGDGAFLVTKGATLTIDGDGTINGVGNNVYNIAIWAYGGHVIINGGTYTNVGAYDEDSSHFDLIYVSFGGSVTINGGTFIAETPQWTLNLKDDDKEGKIIVRGGLFKGYDPANSQTEPLGANNNFVASGYISYLNADGYYSVVKTTSIAEALEIGKEKQHNTYTQEKYILVGTVERIENTEYGNIYIKDDQGKEILIYGLYSADGKTRYDSMSYKPIVGDIIIVNGVLGQFNSNAQMKSGCLVSCTPHTCIYMDATCTTPKTCEICGAKEGESLPHIDGEKDHACDECEAKVGVHEDTTGDSLCDYCGEKISDEIPVVETLAEFTFGTIGSAAHNEGSDLGITKNYDANGYSLSLTGISKVYGSAYDAKGNSCLKIGSSSATGKFSFVVPENVTEVVIYVAQYKTNASSVTINGNTYTLSKASNNGAYDIITIDTTTIKTISFASGKTGDKRCMINTIVFNGYAQ